MTTQLGLFEEAKVSVAEPEPMTTVRVGSRVAQIPLRKLHPQCRSPVGKQKCPG